MPGSLKEFRSPCKRLSFDAWLICLSVLTQMSSKQIGPYRQPRIRVLPT